MKRSYDAHGYFQFESSSTPEALAWYQQVLPCVRDYESFHRVAWWLANHLDAEDLVTLASTAFGPNRPVPSNFFARVHHTNALVPLLSSVCKSIAGAAARRIVALDARDNVARLTSLCELHPDLFAYYACSACQASEACSEWWTVCWSLATQPESHLSMVESLLQLLGSEPSQMPREAVVALAEDCYASRPDAFLAFLSEDHGIEYEGIMGTIFEHADGLRVLLPKLYAHRLRWDDDIERGAWSEAEWRYAQRSLSMHPHAFDVLSDIEKPLALSLFDDNTFVVLRAEVLALFESRRASTQVALAELVARMDLTTLTDSGVLGLRGHRRHTLLLGLAASNKPSVASLLRDVVDDAAHTELSRGMLMDSIERRGLAVQAVETKPEVDPEKLQAYLESIDSVVRVDQSRAAAQGVPQSLPRHVRKSLEEMGPTAASDFALQCVNRWIATAKSKQIPSLLAPAPQFGDAHSADALYAALRSPKGIRTSSLELGTTVLAHTAGPRGLELTLRLWREATHQQLLHRGVDEWTEERRNAHLLRGSERQLRAACERAGTTLEALAEELVPDLGLSSGERLDVGPRSYALALHSDLTLRVVAPDGRTYKRLPKLGPDEDRAKHKLAAKLLRTRQSELDVAAAALRVRMVHAAASGARWELERWRRLFVNHPISSVLARDMVWELSGNAHGDGQRFRIDASGRAVDLAGAAIVADASDFVRAVHPAEVSSDERLKWCAALGKASASVSDDHGVTQWGAPVYSATADQLERSNVVGDGDLHVGHTVLSGLMAAWGYGPSDVENCSVREHAWIVDPSGLRVRCIHSSFSIYPCASDHVTVKALQVERVAPAGTARWSSGEPVAVRLGELPEALRATLLAQSEALIQVAAEGTRMV